MSLHQQLALDIAPPAMDFGADFDTYREEVDLGRARHRDHVILRREPFRGHRGWKQTGYNARYGSRRAAEVSVPRDLALESLLLLVLKQPPRSLEVLGLELVLAFILNCVIVASLDQALKLVARGRPVGNGTGFVYRENPSGALGGVSPAVSGVVLLSAGVLVVALLVMSSWPAVMAAGLGAAMGGAASNFLDQAQHGFVIDYLDVSIGPAINLGDVAITAGLALGVLGLFS